MKDTGDALLSDSLTTLPLSSGVSTDHINPSLDSTTPGLAPSIAPSPEPTQRG